MKIEIGKIHHTVSRKEAATGAALFIFPWLAFLGKEAIEQQIKLLEENKQKDVESLKTENIPSSLDSGDSGLIYSASETYAH